MNLLVTGGAGYIGSATAAELIAAGHTVTVFDNLSRGHRAAIPPEACFVHGDIGDRMALAKVFASGNFDAVLHFAALIEAGESMKDPGLFFRNNVAYSNNVIEAAVKAGCLKFVLSSTAAIFAASDEPLREDSTIAPVNTYGETKLMIETMLKWYGQVHGLRYACLRYFNAAGAAPNRGEAHHPESHLVPRVLHVALGQAESAAIFGADYPTPDGTCIRDYIHIVDLAQAHVLAVEALNEKPTLIYNLGNGQGYSVREVIEAARAVTGHPLPVVEQPRRPGDAPRLVASSEKIRRELGWTPRHPSLHDIIASAWEWHRGHPNGYEPSAISTQSLGR
ncbi:MAG: UDP-glucose 4-epimerase GalE [Chloroflexi bacterium]|nr:UDP-glucose 4-epimerase GalE [Chloroflexota bacterium]